MIKLYSKNVERWIKAAALGVALMATYLLLIQSNEVSKAQSPRFAPNAPATSARYVGGAACAQCHSQKSAMHATSAMANALEPGAVGQILRANPSLTFSHGAWTYEIKRVGNRSLYIVSDGASSFSQPVLWSFGRGHSGQTYVIQRDGVYYETRVSFFSELKALDFTPGAPRNVPATLNDAIGQRLSQPDAMACFNCHSTVAPGAPRFSLDKFTPGIGCETCHGPGEKHIAVMKANRPVTEKYIFNPRAMHPDEMSQQLCGACHRSWETVMGMPAHGGDSNIRFQPYRLANSRCYQNPDDRRISCTACHDPHEDPKHNLVYYDAKCFACHQVTSAVTAHVKASAKDRVAPACPVGKENCASCHMPKIEPPGLHFKFTDHQIRIVKPGEPYPN